MSTPPIPEAGLAEVLGRWIGRGQLYDGLAAARDEADDQDWTGRHLRARAERILFEQIIGSVRELPSRLATWLDAIPASRSQHSFTSDAPIAGTDWVATRIRHGWVPDAFIGRRGARSTDMLLATALKWTLSHLVLVRRGAVQSYPDVDLPVREQIDVAERLLKSPPLLTTDSIRPSLLDITAIARAGRPWGAVARLAKALMVLDDAPDRLIAALLMPDDEIRWRLFHLGVLGVMLQALRARGCSIVSVRPISASSAGPVFRVTDRSGKSWALWFEASGIWAQAGKRPPYAEATAGLALRERALGADLLLISNDGEALVIECKYSHNPEFVARAGYYQAVGYTAELKSRLCHHIVAIVVGPDGVVHSPSFTEMQVGSIGTCAPSHLAACIDDFFLNLAVAATAD
ncbi:hypothetical protein [Sphingomonas sp. PP-CC-3G-468]|uniref:hypothetical protein n=1 Tax=Sphingomonas sp. PP-CC-3G-468 TaxID=2135656 RepID=UPI001052E377|nr:hypothetical protein [Sphingomonas sp. PP-CC-3G-468]TCM04742.1 hypothetical protein C8J41_10838 [Sphingomonas sp. PP-CC-3G-468]